MEEKKYAGHVIPKQLAKFDPWPTMEWIGETDYKTNVTFMITRVQAPCVMEEFPHSHEFDMYLHFWSYDPDDMDSLPAEIEIGLGLGEEREMYTINSPTSVYIPAGMIHCPLIFKRVDKPIILFHTSIASKYVVDQVIKD